MKRKLLFSAALIALAITGNGCASRNLSKVVTALGKDPATIHVRVTSIYGVIEFSRVNANTNTPAHTIAPDGTITVSRETP